MTGMTIGAFLREKVTNMATWLHAEGLPTTGQLPALGDLALTTFAHTLRNDYGECIKARNFTSLTEDKENLPGDVVDLITFVRFRPALHDKFWRYLELFSEVVGSTHE